MIRNQSTLYRSAAFAVIGALSLTAIGAEAARPRGKRPTAAPARPIARVAGLPVGTQRPTTEVSLSIGQGQLITLPQGVANVWTSNDSVADVFVSNPRQIHLFGKAFGEATIFATTASGQVVYATNVRVAQNLTSIDRMLKAAMPDADIKVDVVGQVAVITGTVATPDDVSQASTLVASYLNPGVDVTQQGAMLKIMPINRLKTATPLQVNVQVKIAEVSRSLSKSIGVNLLTRDTTNGFQFNVAQGRNFGALGPVDLSRYPSRDFSTSFGYPAGTLAPLPYAPSNPAVALDPTTGTALAAGALGLGAGKTSLGFLGKLFGIDAAAALDLAENDGLVTMLAEPNLTALSGETASFLAGGEFPIPISQGLGQVSVEYKQFGVSLAFTPTVLADGRISMRVRPEVSQLSTQGAVTLNGFTVPAVTTRRTETTVELGSGQSFMIGGLMQNSNTNSIDKAPGLGDVPVLGALFRSNGYQRNQTELMIIVTPYLVKPVSANQIALPTDGMRTPSDLRSVLLGQDFSGKSGEKRPVPTMAPPVTVPAPSVGAAVMPSATGANPRKSTAAIASPGFSN